MTEIVKTITRIMGCLIMVFGIYLVLHGHLTPGGGFAGGVILAAGMILLILAFGKEVATKILSQSAASILESVGGWIFLGVAIGGFIGGNFFFNFLPKGEPYTLFSGGIIPIANIGIGLKVGSALFAVFLALIILRINDKEK